MTLRPRDDLSQKQGLAAAAASLIKPGQTLFLDCGSTLLELARLLPEDLGLRVVTNSVPVAAALIERRDLWLYQLGGRLHPDVGGCLGAGTIADLGRFRFDLCFLGACALSQDEGLAGFDLDDVELKRSAIAASRATVLMLASAKIDRPAPFLIAPLSALSTYVVQPDLPPTTAQALRLSGADLRPCAPVTA